MVAQFRRFGASFRAATSVEERKGRLRWVVTSYAIAIALFASGVGFAVAGKDHNPIPAAYAYVAPFPGGLRTYGVIQIGIGALYLHALAAFAGRSGRRAWNEMLYVAIAVFTWLLWNAYGFTAFAIQTHTFIASPILYGAFAAIAGVNVVLPPNRREHDPADERA